MRSIPCIFAVLLLSIALASANTAGKVSLKVSDMPIRDICDKLAEQAGVTIVLDPAAKGKVTLTLADADLAHALDVLTEINKLTWKKLSFAKPSESSVSLDQIKASLLALTAMPMMALSVEDPATKTGAVFAKDLPSAPKTDSIPLPEGYKWMTVYVILAPELAPSEEVSKADAKSDIKALSDTQIKNMLELAKLTPEERKQVFANEWMARLNMSPEDRRAILADQISSMFNLEQQYRDQLRQDMREAFHNLHDSNPSQPPMPEAFRHEHGSE